VENLLPFTIPNDLPWEPSPEMVGLWHRVYYINPFKETVMLRYAKLSLSQASSKVAMVSIPGISYETQNSWISILNHKIHFRISDH
jgi:hypothetical protein